MSVLNQILEVCRTRLADMGLGEDKAHKRRLSWEIAEIAAKNKADYFWKLHTDKVRYGVNQNNLLVCKLLGICAGYNIEEEPKCEYGEYPDIDVDYLGVVRDYLKTEWAPKTFGEQYVCNISNYTTFGLKSALIDMARVHGESREEVQALTKNLEAKDDEGKVLTWDAAMKLYPDLKKYCETYPKVADAARRLLNRNRGMGIHAGGLIIANRPLNELVPLVKRKDNPQASAWVEGLHGQDLGPMGLVKFDLLVINNLLQIAHCCRLVKQRHGLTGICNLPNQGDWSDVKAWRNDELALSLADRGDLKGIFQFDKDSVRNMARQGGVTRFEDLVAYTSLNRPGPLGMQMDKRYIERKRGREVFTLHPLLEPILGKTYGIIIYQEQVMQVLNVVGEIPWKDCWAVCKAMSKKKIDGFEKYKNMFILNGQKNLGISDKEINELWAINESFSEYGFNFSHAVAYTYISGQLLYLKAHFPHEFFTAILSCETLSEKIKEYKMEAKVHSIDMHRLDFNKSKETFDLVGDVIYYGMGNVRGIGEEPAKRIVAGQPYQNFEDFLARFGTDAKVLKPLIGLRCFTEADPVTLYKFAECFKDYQKKFEDKKKRSAASLIRYQEEFEDLTMGDTHSTLLSDLTGDQPFDDETWKLIFDKDEEIEVEREIECEENEGGEARWTSVTVQIEGTDMDIEKEELRYFKMAKVKKKFNRWKAMRTLWNRYKKAVEKANNMTAPDVPKLSSFNSSDWYIEDALVKELRDPVACEAEYYGFEWVHDLEKSPDFKGGMTFDQFRNVPEVKVAPVEMKVKGVKKCESKKKKGFFYWQVECEDVTGEQAKMNIWSDDWERWEPEFQKGNLLRVRVAPPSGGFPTYTFDSPPRQYRWKQVPKNKDDDFRVVVMRHATRQIDKCLTDDEAMEMMTRGIQQDDND